jgi:hypothetical protein
LRELTGKVAPGTPGPQRKNEIISSFKQTKAANATKNPNTQKVLALTLCTAFGEMVVAEGTGFPLLPAPIQSAQALR